MSVSEMSTSKGKANSRSLAKRVLPLIAVAAFFVFGISFFSSKRGKEASVDSKARVEVWVGEVLEFAAESTCRGETQDLSKREITRTRTLVPLFRERARLDPGDNLRMLKRVETLLQCSRMSIEEGEAGDPAGGIEKKEWDSWVRLRSELQGRVQLLLRAHHARLRRAESRRDKEASLIEVRTLKRLLAAHSGPLSLFLLRLERSLGD